MLPLRYDFHNFGGSWAQRQVFSVTMIQAAVRANKLSLALSLLTELKVTAWPRIYNKQQATRMITINFRGGIFPCNIGYVYVKCLLTLAIGTDKLLL